MDVAELWRKTCDILQKDMNYISYQTFIENNLFPVSVTEDTLTLRIVMEQMKSMVVNRYQELIVNCLTQVVGHPMECIIKSESELKKEQEQTRVKKESTSPARPWPWTAE